MENINNTLAKITKEVEIQPSCQGTVEEVLCKAYLNGLYAKKLLITPKTGNCFHRVNREEKIVLDNHHETSYFYHNGVEYVIDADSIKKVYTVEDYQRECFEEEVLLRIIEET